MNIEWGVDKNTSNAALGDKGLAAQSRDWRAVSNDRNEMLTTHTAVVKMQMYKLRGMHKLLKAGEGSTTSIRLKRVGSRKNYEMLLCQAGGFSMSDSTAFLKEWQPHYQKRGYVPSNSCSR